MLPRAKRSEIKRPVELLEEREKRGQEIKRGRRAKLKGIVKLRPVTVRLRPIASPNRNTYVNENRVPLSPQK